MTKLPKPMEKLKLYLETSVPSHLFCTDAPDAREATETLFRQIQAGKHEAVLSSAYFLEVAKVPSVMLRYQLRGVPGVYNLDVLPVTAEARELMTTYIEAGAFTETHRLDALHVAMASVGGCDLLVSWNFRHIVRAWTMKRVAEVHTERNLKQLVLCTPLEVIGSV